MPPRTAPCRPQAAASSQIAAIAASCCSTDSPRSLASPRRQRQQGRGQLTAVPVEYQERRTAAYRRGLLQRLATRHGLPPGLAAHRVKASLRERGLLPSAFEDGGDARPHSGCRQPAATKRRAGPDARRPPTGGSRRSASWWHAAQLRMQHKAHDPAMDALPRIVHAMLYATPPSPSDNSLALKYDKYASAGASAAASSSGAALAAAHAAVAAGLSLAVALGTTQTTTVGAERHAYRSAMHGWHGRGRAPTASFMRSYGGASLPASATAVGGVGNSGVVQASTSTPRPSAARQTGHGTARQPRSPLRARQQRRVPSPRAARGALHQAAWG